MTELLIVSPLLLPLLLLIICLSLGNHGRAAAAVSLAGTCVLLAASTVLLLTVHHHGTLTLASGGWKAPFGIILVADPLAVMMVWISAFVALAVLIYGVRSPADATARPGTAHVLVQGLMLGVNGSFLTGDLFNLYVWFEVMLISSFILMVREKRRDQLSGGLTYVILNLIASAMFLCGAGLIYGKTGTLNMADIAVKLSTLDDPGFINTTGVLLFVAFAAKAGLFPFHFWLPASYHHAGAAISALFAGLLTKVGVYALLRMFTLVFTEENGFSTTLILYLSMATMLIGVLGAVAQYNVRRLLAFHIISQIGYMTAGLAIGGAFALTAVIFYIVHHIAVKSTLFLVGGILEDRAGTPDIRRHGGNYQNQPLLAACFLIPALSLGGIPPFSGFWAKLNLLQAGVERQEWFFIAMALGVGILTLFSMIKIWNESFWKPAPDSETSLSPSPTPLNRYGAMLLLCALTLIFSLGGKWVFDFSAIAARDLAEPAGYIRAVLKGGTP